MLIYQEGPRPVMSKIIDIKAGECFLLDGRVNMRLKRKDTSEFVLSAELDSGGLINHGLEGSVIVETVKARAMYEKTDK